MAVPKKRTSKAKKNARKANWKRKSYQAAQKSLSLAKSMLRGKSTSFVYTIHVLTQSYSTSKSPSSRQVYRIYPLCY